MEMGFSFTDVQVDYKIDKPVRTQAIVLRRLKPSPAICDQKFATCCWSDTGVYVVL